MDMHISIRLSHEEYNSLRNILSGRKLYPVKAKNLHAPDSLLTNIFNMFFKPILSAYYIFYRDTNGFTLYVIDAWLKDAWFVFFGNKTGALHVSIDRITVELTEEPYRLLLITISGPAERYNCSTQ